MDDTDTEECESNCQATAATISERADCADVRTRTLGLTPMDGVPLPCPRGQFRRQERLVGSSNAATTACSRTQTPGDGTPATPAALTVTAGDEDRARSLRSTSSLRSSLGGVRSLRRGIHRSSATRFSTDKKPSTTLSQTTLPLYSALGRRNHSVSDLAAGRLPTNPRRLAWQRKVRIPRARRQRHRRKRLDGTSCRVTVIPTLPIQQKSGRRASRMLTARSLGKSEIFLEWTVPASNGNRISDYDLQRWDGETETWARC